jgi:cold shock protein
VGADGFCLTLDVAPSAQLTMARGTVKWFNSQKGKCVHSAAEREKDVFVHISAVEKVGLPGLNEGQVVEYEEVSNRGKTSAENLKAER